MHTARKNLLALPMTLLPDADMLNMPGELCLQAASGENPKAAAVREQLRKRLSEQEEKERATKTELVQKAANYLEQFYEVGYAMYQ